MPVIITMWINKKNVIIKQCGSNNRIDPNEQRILNFAKIVTFTIVFRL